jgi:valine--pyruvate aminotransferase
VLRCIINSVKLSDFGEKMNGEAKILRLMDDLGKALADNPPLAMFGGGNPAQIPEVTKSYKKSLESLMADDSRVSSMLGNYDTPQGNTAFISAVKDFFNRHYGLGITEKNIAITPGSQSGTFILFNLLAGNTGGKKRKILFPVVPEYVGYVDQTLEPDSFASVRPLIEKVYEHEFKYKVDFDGLNIGGDIAGLCVSRPTNPSGNVITDKEMERLGSLAEKHDIPLIIDSAYGLPFPGVVKPDIKIFWNSNTVLSFTLSKVGLPSSRIGIFIGPEELMSALTNANAIISLANPSFGQYVTTPLIESDEILSLSREHIKPFYFEREKKARELIFRHFPKDLPWRLHAYEGSYFYWLWLEGSKMTSVEIYDWLKSKGVLVVPGEYFFPGQNVEGWQHAKECLRLNFARPDGELEVGIPILAEAVVKAYKR